MAPTWYMMPNVFSLIISMATLLKGFPAGKISMSAGLFKDSSAMYTFQRQEKLWTTGDFQQLWTIFKGGPPQVAHTINAFLVKDFHVDKNSKLFSIKGE